MMDGGTDVSTIHHRDIYSYYLALQKYFNNAETKHDRSNSPRAQKARAKLLKLSASQFYELSTDVYDELQRRTSEDKSQPEYLLPKATFHMKRNQARQKLANLSNTRFNDLVDDILFEIKRRGYNEAPDPDMHGDKHVKSTVLTGSSTPRSKKTSDSHLKPAESDTSSPQVPPTATIQTSKVIPQKASIDWSSDDDEHDTERNTTTNNDNTKNAAYRDGVHDGMSRDLRSGGVTPPPDISALQQPNTTPLLNSTDTYHHYGDVIDSPALTEPGNSQRGDETHSGDLTNNRHSSTFDFEGLSKDESNLSKSIQQSAESQNQGRLDELHNEIEALKKENASLKQLGSLRGFTPNENFQKDLSSISAEVGSLSVENEQLKAKISELEFRVKNSGTKKSSPSLPSTSSSHNELEKLALDGESVTRYAAQDGSIPFESVQLFHQYVKKLFADLQIEVDDIGHTLFEDLSCLSHTVAQLFVLVDVPDFKEEVILLKASLSHTITAIRYFAVYGALLPRVTVQAAISELAFAFCNLVRSCKIKGDGRGGAALGSRKISSDNINSPLDPPTPGDRNIQNTKSGNPFNRPTVTTNFDDDFGPEEMSPVKPLKITQKAGMSPGARTPLSAKKQSVGLPFGPMVDTKSPASRGKGNLTGPSFEKSKEWNETSPTSSQSDTTDLKPLSTRVRDPSGSKDLPIKDLENLKDPNIRDVSKDTFDNNNSPNRSTATSKSGTGDGTTTLPTPLSTASTSANEPKKLGKDFVDGSRLGPQVTSDLPVNINKKRDPPHFKNPEITAEVENRFRGAKNKEPTQRSDSISRDNITDNFARSTEISNDFNNKGITGKSANYDKLRDTTNPFREEPSPNGKEPQPFPKSSPENNNQKVLELNGPKDDEATQSLTKNTKPESPNRIKTSGAIKDAMSKLEGTEASDQQNQSETNSTINPTKVKPEEKEIEYHASKQENNLDKQPDQFPLQEDKSKKNAGKSFTEKLKTFASNAGIGLRADKDQKGVLSASPQTKDLESGKNSDDRNGENVVNVNEKNDISKTDHGISSNKVDDIIGNEESGTSTAISKNTKTSLEGTSNGDRNRIENNASTGEKSGSNSNLDFPGLLDIKDSDNGPVKNNGGLLEKKLDKNQGEVNEPRSEINEKFSRNNAIPTNGKEGRENSRDPDILHMDNRHSPLNTKRNVEAVDDLKDAFPDIEGKKKAFDDPQNKPFKSAEGNFVSRDGLGLSSANNIPSVTLNDGKKETDITPRGDLRPFESKAVDRDEETSSKLPNFYFNNISKPPPTNQNLTDKLKKTFADLPSEEETEEGSDLNNSPYMSDDGSVFRAFKQSWREENGASRGSPLIQQHNISRNDSEIREKPAGLGLSENTNLGFNKESNGIPTSSNRFDSNLSTENENQNNDKRKQATQHNPQEHSLDKIKANVLPKDTDGGEEIINGRAMDFKRSNDTDDSMMNPGEYLKNHNKVGAGNNTNDITTRRDSFLSEQDSREKFHDANKRWDSTDEEEEDDDVDSYKNAFVENRLDNLEKNSILGQPKQKNVNKPKENVGPIGDNNYSATKKKSPHNDSSQQNREYNKQDFAPMSDTSDKKSKANASTTKSMVSTDDLNAEPSFADEREFVDAPGPKSDYSMAPQLQPVKLVSSNTQSNDQLHGFSDKNSNDKSEFQKKGDDNIKGLNTPKTPVMKSSTVRPQSVKTPTGKSPSMKSPATRSPAARSLASNRTDDGEYTFDVDAFDIDNPDNTLSELLLYLEHQSLQVIATIQSLLTSIKEPHATKGNLRKESNAINQVIRQMVDATSVSMNQSRNASLKEHGSWVVKSLEDCYLRMTSLCQLNRDGEFINKPGDEDYADKHFKQRLAGIAFDIAKCTKELVKTVEEASLKEEIEFLNSRLN